MFFFIISSVACPYCVIVAKHCNVGVSPSVALVLVSPPYITLHSSLAQIDLKIRDVSSVHMVVKTHAFYSWKRSTNQTGGLTWFPWPWCFCVYEVACKRYLCAIISAWVIKRPKNACKKCETWRSVTAVFIKLHYSLMDSIQRGTNRCKTCKCTLSLHSAVMCKHCIFSTSKTHVIQRLFSSYHLPWNFTRLHSTNAERAVNHRAGDDWLFQASQLSY